MKRGLCKYLILLVGARGFEPPTPCSQGRCAKPGCATPRQRVLLVLFIAAVKWSFTGCVLFPGCSYKKRERDGCVCRQFIW